MLNCDDDSEECSNNLDTNANLLHLDWSCGLGILCHNMRILSSESLGTSELAVVYNRS